MKKVVRENDISELMDKYNPLALRDHTERLDFYKEKWQCYKEGLMRVVKYFNHGYVDLYLLLDKLYGLSIGEAEKIIAGWKDLGIYHDPLLVNWTDDEERAYYCERIIQGLCRCTGSRFDAVAYKQAYAAFEKDLETITIVHLLKTYH